MEKQKPRQRQRQRQTRKERGRLSAEEVLFEHADGRKEINMEDVREEIGAREALVNYYGRTKQKHDHSQSKLSDQARMLRMLKLQDTVCGLLHRMEQVEKSKMTEKSKAVLVCSSMQTEELREVPEAATRRADERQEKKLTGGSFTRTDLFHLRQRLSHLDAIIVQRSKLSRTCKDEKHLGPGERRATDQAAARSSSEAPDLSPYLIELSSILSLLEGKYLVTAVHSVQTTWSDQSNTGRMIDSRRRAATLINRNVKMHLKRRQRRGLDDFPTSLAIKGNSYQQGKENHFLSRDHAQSTVMGVTDVWLQVTEPKVSPCIEQISPIFGPKVYSFTSWKQATKRRLLWKKQTIERWIGHCRRLRYAPFRTWKAYMIELRQEHYAHKVLVDAFRRRRSRLQKLTVFKYWKHKTIYAKIGSGLKRVELLELIEKQNRALELLEGAQEAVDLCLEEAREQRSHHVSRILALEKTVLAVQSRSSDLELVQARLQKQVVYLQSLLDALSLIHAGTYRRLKQIADCRVPIDEQQELDRFATVAQQKATVSAATLAALPQVQVRTEEEKLPSAHIQACYEQLQEIVSDNDIQYHTLETTWSDVVALCGALVSGTVSQVQELLAALLQQTKDRGNTQGSINWDHLNQFLDEKYRVRIPKQAQWRDRFHLRLQTRYNKT